MYAASPQYGCRYADEREKELHLLVLTVIHLQFLHNIYNRAKFTFNFYTSILLSSNVWGWPYFLCSSSGGSRQQSLSKSNLIAVIVHACKFQRCSSRSPDRWSISSHQKLCRMNVILTSRAFAEIKIIFTEKQSSYVQQLTRYMGKASG